MNNLGLSKIVLILIVVAIIMCPLVAMSKTSELVIYTALETDEYTRYIKDFEKKYPDIKVEIIRDSTGIITARLLAEKDNPQADAVWGVALTSLMACDQKDVFKGYNPKGLASIQDNFQDQKNKAKHWVGIKAWMACIVVNKIEFEAQHIDSPKSYSDLIDSKYKGMLAMPHPASSGTGYMTISAIFQLMGEEKGWQYLDKLHKNVAVYTHSGSKPAMLAAKGEFPVGITLYNRGVKLKIKGEPIEVYLPKEGTGWEVEANALIKKPRTKRAAKTFLDWAISIDAMRMYAEILPVVGHKQVMAELKKREGKKRTSKASLIDSLAILPAPPKQIIFISYYLSCLTVDFLLFTYFIAGLTGAPYTQKIIPRRIILPRKYRLPHIDDAILSISCPDFP